MERSSTTTGRAPGTGRVAARVCGGRGGGRRSPRDRRRRGGPARRCGSSPAAGAAMAWWPLKTGSRVRGTDDLRPLLAAELPADWQVGRREHVGRGTRAGRRRPRPPARSAPGSGRCRRAHQGRRRPAASTRSRRPGSTSPPRGPRVRPAGQVVAPQFGDSTYNDGGEAQGLGALPGPAARRRMTIPRQPRPRRRTRPRSRTPRRLLAPTLVNG